MNQQIILPFHFVGEVYFFDRRDDIVKIDYLNNIIFKLQFTINSYLQQNHCKIK